MMKKLGKKLAMYLLTAVLSCSAAMPGAVQAHSGRTDSNGGHRDNQNKSGLGFYHYHCGGHPAHLHPNGVCPYASAVDPVPETPAQNTSPADSASTEPAQEPLADAAVSTPSRVKLSAKKLTLLKGKSRRLKITGTSKKVTWSSTRKSVAVVSSTGKVTGKKKGSATIIARVGGKKYTCKVTVEEPKLNRTSLTLGKKQKSRLVLSGTTKTVKWISQNPAVAVVNSKGVVRGTGIGTTTVTARVDGRSYVCKIKVTKGS